MNKKLYTLALASLLLIGCGGKSSIPYESDFEEEETYYEVSFDDFYSAAQVADDDFVDKTNAEGGYFHSAEVKGYMDSKALGYQLKLQYEIDYTFETVEGGTEWVPHDATDEEILASQSVFLYTAHTFGYTLTDAVQVTKTNLKFYRGDEDGFKVKGDYAYTMMMDEITFVGQSDIYYVFNSDGVAIHMENKTTGKTTYEGATEDTPSYLIADIEYNL